MLVVTLDLESPAHATLVRFFDLDLVTDVMGIGVMPLFIGRQTPANFTRLAEERHAADIAGRRHPPIVLPPFPAVGVGAHKPQPRLLRKKPAVTGNTILRAPLNIREVGLD